VHTKFYCVQGVKHRHTIFHAWCWGLRPEVSHLRPLSVTMHIELCWIQEDLGQKLCAEGSLAPSGTVNLRRMESYFKGLTVEYVECNKNTEADDQRKAATRNTSMPTDVLFQVVEDASVKTVLPEPRLTNIIEGEDWRAPIMTYLHHYYEPDSKNEQTRMKQ
jgi:hypothetical protein